MKCKAFDVEVELEIQAITCPGVWLCPNGNITVQIYLLGLCTQTSSMVPVFPLLCHEKFTFHKKFPNIQNLYDLDHKLGKEVVYMELIQWEDCDKGNVLATFKTSLMELLYPFPKRKGVVSGIDVDLLMEATRKFPGIISPKTEISSKITVREIMYSLKKDKINDSVVVNPKIISSKCVPKRHIPVRQKKVCHSYKYHKCKLSNKKFSSNIGGDCEHIFASPKNSEQRKPKKRILNKRANELTEEFMVDKLQKLRNSKIGETCACNKNKVLCPLCEKYKCYFSNLCSCNEQNNPTRISKLESAEFLFDDEQNDKEKKSIEKISPRSKAGSDHIRERLINNIVSPTSLPLPGRDNLSDEETCTQRFYKNLEQFYKQLYMHAHYKLKNEKCKCAK